MSAQDRSRWYVCLSADKELLEKYREAVNGQRETDSAEFFGEHFKNYLRRTRLGDENAVDLVDRIRVSRSQPLEWELQLQGNAEAQERLERRIKDEIKEEPDDVRKLRTEVERTLCIEVSIKNDAAIDEFRAALPPNPLGPGQSIGANLRVRLADARPSWSPFEAADPIFGTRNDALRLIRADEPFTEECDKRHQTTVNVVLIDQGVGKPFIEHLRRGSYGGQWVRQSDPESKSQPVRTSVHGRMMCRNILSAAPRARIFDFPLISTPIGPDPRALYDDPAFLCRVEAAFRRLFLDINCLRASGKNEWQSWVLVNPWAAVDSSVEEQSEGSKRYTDNPEHSFNQLITKMVVDLNVDMVFSASNCGDLCPDTRCGIANRGPGRSILGANGHPSVLTVGAVRTDGVLLGYSSVGPAMLKPNPRDLQEFKPDLCAPSNFHEDRNAFDINTGTSSACGLAAGVVAALRGCVRPNAFPPDRMRRYLWSTAVPQGREPLNEKKWNPRTGFGIINAEYALKAILSGS